MTTIRRTGLVGFFGVGIAVLSWACTRGPLFAWSPVRPGYYSVATPRATAVLPINHAPAIEAEKLDRLMDSVSFAIGLPWVSPITVIQTADWRLFNIARLSADGSRRVPVLGAALQTGHAILLSPMLQDSGWSADGVILHELSHALLYQHSSLLGSFELRKAVWLLEGIAYWIADTGNRLTYKEWLALARRSGYLGSDGDDTYLQQLPDSIRARFVFAEYGFFIDHLVAQRGLAEFQSFLSAVVAAPGRLVPLFEQSYGMSLEEARAAFRRTAAEVLRPHPTARMTVRRRESARVLDLPSLSFVGSQTRMVAT